MIASGWLPSKQAKHDIGSNVSLLRQFKIFILQLLARKRKYHGSICHKTYKIFGHICPKNPTIKFFHKIIWVNAWWQRGHKYSIKPATFKRVNFKLLCCCNFVQKFKTLPWINSSQNLKYLILRHFWLRNLKTKSLISHQLPSNI